MTNQEENLDSSMQKLESIVNELNGGSIGIEESQKKFKEGVGLVKTCKGRLQQIENEFIELKNELENKG